MEHLLVWLVVGLVAGWLAGKVMTGHGFGIIVDILVGIVGAFIGGYMAGLVGIAVRLLGPPAVVVPLHALSGNGHLAYGPLGQATCPALAGLEVELDNASLHDIPRVRNSFVAMA